MTPHSFNESRGGDGVIYIATGERFIREASESVRSLKRFHPDLHCTLLSDSSELPEEFDRHVLISNPFHSLEDKVRNILNHDYERVVFLDSDTRIAGDISHLFRILETYDFAASIEISRGYWYRALDLPDTFPELNSGVMAFRRSPQVERMLKQWPAEYEASKQWQLSPRYNQKRVNDQASLRKLLYENRDVRLCAFPTEFNALQLTGTFVWGPARILHGRNKMERFEQSLNRHPQCIRVYLQQIGTYRGWANMSAGELFDFWWRSNAVVALGFGRVLRRCFMRVTGLSRNS